MATTTSLLHTYKIEQPHNSINRLHILFHTIAVTALLYYRISNLFSVSQKFPWALMCLAELLLTILWLLQQPFKWRPVVREVYTDNLPTQLPAVDVFICTIDPTKEPVVDVMNTVISAMAIDLPPDKLAVYLSDDGGVPLTSFAVKEAGKFAKSWVPFCRKYGIKAICPKAYFSRMADDERLLHSSDSQFKDDELHIKVFFSKLYEEFESILEKARERFDDSVVSDRPPCVEIIQSYRSDDQAGMPMLVYVSRERRPSRPHRFKAGALNALLRVSAVMTRAPYILVLDCDMLCNDPASAKESMCFLLDQKMSKSLAFVQFPQIFHNLGKNDIYDAQGRATYKSQWRGMDGLRGPFLSGTGYYMKRKVLFATPDKADTVDEFTSGLGKFSDLVYDKDRESANDKLGTAQVLATCTFEDNSDWGKEIGFSYGSLLESSFTGYLLHCRGWRSVYHYPNRPAFMGCAPTDLKDVSTQLLKWISGLFQIGLSKLNPITYGMSNMSIGQSMCYAYFMYICLYTISLLIYGILPQLYFFKGIPLYPQASSPWFWLFVLVYASSLFEQLYEVFCTGGSVKVWWNEYRIWMIQSVTGLMFGAFDAFWSLSGMGKLTFRLTPKTTDEEKVKKSEQGKFDFQGAGKFVVPLAILVVLTVVCFVGGLKTMFTERSFNDMFGQFMLSSLLTYVSYSIILGIATMKR
ncbi:cellulose synthase-like protein G2 [Impatiens glandulifera]|uniref:cellulose synthase-like protein G2 n=1 Tax=Impatiens glandulifera TaxID=253017 RepID=UPI001FB0CF35|nr:cellulose synthase-like protein G2 [Impatiens glandulifera]